MAFQSVPDTMEIVVNMRLHGVPVVNVLAARGAGAPSPSALEGIAVLVADWWQVSLAPEVSTELFLTGVTTRDLTSALGPSYELLVSPNASGQVPGGSLPGNVAFVVSHRTGFGGRSFRGRSYVPGIPGGSFDNNEVLPAFADGVTNAFNVLRSRLGEGTWALAVVSRFTGGAERPAGISTPITNSTYANLKVDTQRRRLS